MNNCELCHEETRTRKRTGKRKELLCGECREGTAYYDSLTPAEWAQEQAAMSAYVVETERETY